VQKKKTGRSLEGRTWDEMPELAVLYRNRGIKIKQRPDTICSGALAYDKNCSLL